jgi:hypothetical protein
VTGPVFRGPAELVRGRAIQVAPSLQDADGDAVTPTSWSGKLWRGDTLMASTTGTTSLSWLITAGATWDLGAEYMLEWYIAWSGGSITTRQPALVCYSQLETDLRPIDLWRLQPALNPDAPAPILVLATGTTIADIIAESWQLVLAELRQRGFRADRIINGYDLKNPHAWLTLALLLEAASGSVGDTGNQWATQAEKYRAMWEKYWLTATFAVAETRTSNAAAATPPLMVGGSFSGLVNPWERRRGL